MTEWNKIKHLYLRAGFGLGQDELISKQSSTLDKEIKEILYQGGKKYSSRIPNEFKTWEKSKNSDSEKGGDKRSKILEVRKLTPLVTIDWVKQMADTSNPLLERMTLFWHGHFACRIKLPHLAANHINTIRKHALGNFKDLVKSIVQDPSMIIYLDNQQNSKQKPNENFARELLELFTIGIGNYTEEDVKEGGRALTGWRVNRLEGEAVMIDRRQDKGVKVFMGDTGRFTGDDLVDIILSKRETSLFIAKKIYTYFVNPKPNKRHIQSIAAEFYNTGYDIKAMMSYIFKSDWFYAKEHIGVKIKSPIDLLVGMMKTLQLEFKNPKNIIQLQRSMGQHLFNPPNVAGWQRDKEWINNATLMTRLSLPVILLMSKDVQISSKKGKKSKISAGYKKKVDLCHLSEAVKNKTDAEIVKIYTDFLLQVSIGSKKNLVSKIDTSKTAEDKVKILLYRVMSLPEYQMC